MINFQSISKHLCSSSRKVTLRPIEKQMSNHSIMGNLAERLIEARTEKGWKPADLRRAAKIKSPSTISEIESGKRTESPQLAVIADALGVEVLWLQHGRGPKYKISRQSEAEPTDDNVAFYMVAQDRGLKIVKQAPPPLTADEQILLNGYRASSDEKKQVMIELAESSIARFTGRNENKN